MLVSWLKPKAVVQGRSWWKKKTNAWNLGKTFWIVGGEMEAWELQREYRKDWKGFRWEGKRSSETNCEWCSWGPVFMKVLSLQSMNQEDLNNTLNCTFSFPEVQSLLLGLTGFLLRSFQLANRRITCQWDAAKKMADVNLGHIEQSIIHKDRVGLMPFNRFLMISCLRDRLQFWSHTFKKADCKLKWAQRRTTWMFRGTEKTGDTGAAQFLLAWTGCGA